MQTKLSLLFFVVQEKKIDCEVKLKLNGKRLFPSRYIKYLGVLVDEHLSWNYHINDLVKKLNRSNSMLSRIRHFVDKNTMRSLYFTLFSSHINYCCQV